MRYLELSLQIIQIQNYVDKKLPRQKLFSILYC